MRSIVDRLLASVGLPSTHVPDDELVTFCKRSNELAVVGCVNAPVGLIFLFWCSRVGPRCWGLLSFPGDTSVCLLPAPPPAPLQSQLPIYC